jgi:hypothetical protein
MLGPPWDQRSCSPSQGYWLAVLEHVTDETLTGVPLPA